MGMPSATSVKPIEGEANLGSRANNIGLLRSFFASLVLFSHCFPLTQGNNLDEPLFARTRTMTMGMLAVHFFFLLSGYLIAQSWLRRPDARDFLVKRFLRIYPAYAVALLFSLIAGIVGSEPNTWAYIKGICSEADRFFQSLLFFENGGVDSKLAFQDNPYPYFVNGSLWTLQPEVKCYLLVLFLGIFQLLAGRSLIVLTVAAIGIYCVTAIRFKTLELTIWRLYAYFLIGAYIATLDKSRLLLILRKPLLVVPSLIIVGAVSRLPFLFLLALPVLGSYVVLAIAFNRMTVGASFFRRFDLSYGIYLYAYPVQQLIVFKFGVRSPLELFAYALPATLVMAFLSWRYIESPFLRRKPG